jgi:hypothetical protein
MREFLTDLTTEEQELIEWLERGRKRELTEQEVNLALEQARQLPERLSSSVQEKDHDCGDNAQRDEDEQRDPHANRDAVGKRGLTGWDSHEPREPFVEFHSMPSFRIRRTLCRARIC